MTTPNSYANAYNGTYNADDPLVAPWWVPGWTAQDKISIAAGNENLLGPGFPTNLAFVNITGNYFDTNSSGAGGFLTLMMSDGIMIEDGGNYFRLPQRLTGTMNEPLPFAFNNWGNGPLYLRLGRLNIQVFATDQTASESVITTDAGGAFTYYVTEHMLGGRQFQISVPSSDAGTSVDINSLIVAGSVQPYQYDPVNPMGNMLIPVPEPTD